MSSSSSSSDYSDDEVESASPFKPKPPVHYQDMYHTPERKLKRQKLSQEKPKSTAKKRTPRKSTIHSSYSAPDASTYHQNSTSVGSWQLPPLMAYTLQLMAHGGCVVLQPNVFAVQMYDSDNCKLKVYNYEVVSRREALFEKRPVTIWNCSCSIFSQSFNRGLPADMDESFRRVIAEHCFHIEAVGLCIEDTEAVSPIPDEHGYNADESIVKAPGHDATVLVYLEDKNLQLGVVRVKFERMGEKKPYLYCHKCCKKSCHHISHVREALKEDHVPDVLSEIDTIMNSGHSRYVPRKIPKALFNQKLQHMVREKPEHHLPTELVPNKCSKCDEVVLRQDWCCRTYYYAIPPKLVKMYSLTCECGTSKYDGTDDPVIHMGYYAISHAVLRKYLDNFVCSGMPMYTFYKTWLMSLHRLTGDNLQDHLRYGMFRLAVAEFIGMLDYDRKAFFKCPQCGPHPQRPVFDAQTLGLQKVFLPQPVEAQHSEKELDGSRFQTRIFVPHKDTRLMLNSYSKGKDFNLVKLKELLNKHQSSLLPFINNNPGCPEWAQSLMRDLSSSSTVAATLMPEPALLAACTTLAAGETLSCQQLTVIHDRCLPIYKIIHEGKLHDPLLMSVITEMMKLSVVPYATDTCQELEEQKDVIDVGAFYPNMPVVRERGNYVMDPRNKKKAKKKLNNRGVEEGSCQKDAPGHPTLSPGVMSVMCEHGITMGFELLQKCESPNNVFTTLITRYPSAPEFVIYDNACHAFNYAMNRNPRFFKGSRFVSDRLHWKNHDDCTSGHNIDSYKKLFMVNSQVVEQRHSCLKRLKSMLSYMTLENFMQFLAYFHLFQNGVKMGCDAPQSKNEFGDLKKMLRRN